MTKKQTDKRKDVGQKVIKKNKETHEIKSCEGSD